MARIAFVGDIHLADKNHADEFSYEKRHHYVDQHEYVREQIQTINGEKPDHIVLLGDLVDWYSKENIEFALEVINKFDADWDLTPGNHDMQLPVSKWAKHNNEVVHEDADITSIVCRKKALIGWSEKGVTIKSRKIEFGDTSIFLLDSSLGFIASEDQEWFVNIVDSNKTNIIATHVPFPFAESRKKLVENNKDVLDYYQSNLSELFIEKIFSSVNHIFFGHVHFTRKYKEQDINMYMIKNSNVPLSDISDTGVYYIEV